MGYAGRDSETESAHPEIKERRSATVDCYVWFVVPLHRRNSREDLRPSLDGKRDASAFSFFLRVRKKSEALTLLRVSHKFGCKGFARINKEF
jgi:hypothetical protein